MNLENSRARSKLIVLNNLDVVMAANDSQCRSQRTLLDYFGSDLGDEFLTLIRIREIDVPGVELPRDICK